MSSAPRIISKWFELIKNEFPDTPATHYAVEKGEVYSESDGILPEQGTRRSYQHTYVHTVYEAALSQIDKIVDLFAECKDQQASSILNQLIDGNLQSRSGEELAVKSLCNVAKKVASRGREDICTRCLSDALKYPNGIDHVLYIQIATEFRDLGKLNEAIECFNKAEYLARGNDSSLAIIHTAKIHILTIQGKYDQALQEYHNIQDYNLKPNIICSIADLYRKSGRLGEAREYYERCLRFASETDRAVAGLAEVWKQKGNAIAQSKCTTNFLETLKNWMINPF